VSLPFQQEVHRRDPYVGETFYSQDANVRVPLDIYPHHAPDPVRDSDFWSQGKPFSHAWAHAQRFISTNIPGILSIDAWTGEVQRIAKYVRSNVVSTPLGAQHAFVERVNIERAASAPYGSTVAVHDPANVSLFDIRGYRMRGS
jgi:hypothetical protein